MDIIINTQPLSRHSIGLGKNGLTIKMWRRMGTTVYEVDGITRSLIFFMKLYIDVAPAIYVYP